MERKSTISHMFWPLFLGSLVAMSVHADDASVDCTNTIQALDYWQPIRDNAADQEQNANELAVALLPCLGSRNSVLRDRVAYELLTYWLRNDGISNATRRTMLQVLMERLAIRPDPEPTDRVFFRSFSALILAEIMRSDAQKEFMTDSERSHLLTTGLAALAMENDYRGLDADFGWIHPLAHESDLLWRFTLHPKTDSAQAKLILDAVGKKSGVTDAFYHFNEGDRLARSAALIISRGLVSDQDIEQWLATFATPTSMPTWNDAFKSRVGMAELHNTKQFIRSLRAQIDMNAVDESIVAQLDALQIVFAQLI